MATGSGAPDDAGTAAPAASCATGARGGARAGRAAVAFPSLAGLDGSWNPETTTWGVLLQMLGG